MREGIARRLLADFILYVYTYIHIYIYTYIYIYIYTYIHIYAYIQAVGQQSGTSMYTYIHIYIYVYIHICIYTYMYIYIYTYIRIYRLWGNNLGLACERLLSALYTNDTLIQV